MAKKVTKLKGTAETAPQTRDEVSRDIRKLGDEQREAIRLEAAMNDEIAEITERYTPQIEAHKKCIKALFKGISDWCKTNRDELTNGGKTKTANLTTGNVSWRLGTPSCSVSRDVEGVIEMLRRMQLDRFIRVKEEVNKEAVLAEPDAVKGIAGIKVNKGSESFYVEPFEQDAGITK
ncbi:host-nuclease inhibitor protein Gam [Salmonella enterica subsp. diarizonae]|nr:host-nuclease inhibitor protein Gam [Salmonella enterica subsp. diarizonae]